MEHGGANIDQVAWHRAMAVNIDMGAISGENGEILRARGRFILLVKPLSQPSDKPGGLAGGNLAPQRLDVGSLRAKSPQGKLKVLLPFPLACLEPCRQPLYLGYNLGQI
jgi:hypothetical protein